MLTVDRNDLIIGEDAIEVEEDQIDVRLATEMLLPLGLKMGLNACHPLHLGAQTKLQNALQKKSELELLDTISLT